MAAGLVPGSGIIICHQVPEIKVFVHAADVHLGEVLRTGRAGHRDLKVVTPAGIELLRVGIELLAYLGEELDEMACLVGILRILPVDVYAIKTVRFEECDARFGES